MNSTRLFTLSLVSAACLVVAVCTHLLPHVFWYTTASLLGLAWSLAMVGCFCLIDERRTQRHSEAVLNRMIEYTRVVNQANWSGQGEPRAGARVEGSDGEPIVLPFQPQQPQGR